MTPVNCISIAATVIAITHRVGQCCSHVGEASGILIGMTNLTTVKVSMATRDGLKAIADREGITLDAALQTLLRLERQRQMGADLAAQCRSDEDAAWIRGSVAAVARAIG